jgi:hypothetical protein
MLAKSLQIITGLLGTAVRSFAIVVLILETGWGLLLAIACFWVASHGSTARGVIAVALALALVTVSSLVIAVYLSCLSVVQKAVTDVHLGRTIFDSLFERVLGVSGNDTGERPEAAKIPTHMSKVEVEETLNSAARHLLSIEAPSTKWAGPLFWLAKQIQRISVWATVKVIVKSCSHDGSSVNMFELRDRLASTIDQGVVKFIKQYITRLAFTLISAVSTVSLLFAYVISLLPI